MTAFAMIDPFPHLLMIVPIMYMYIVYTIANSFVFKVVHNFQESLQNWGQKKKTSKADWKSRSIKQ
jgi:hypothetical protein